MANEFEETVRNFESQVKDGDASGLAQQLAKMPLEERKAISHQIQLDESKTDMGLPHMEFTNDGHLKSADVNLGAVKEHDVYDQKTGRVESSDAKLPDGFKEHLHNSYDAEGRLVSTEKNNTAGWKESLKFDPETGKEIDEKLVNKDGKVTHHEEYDRNGVPLNAEALDHQLMEQQANRMMNQEVERQGQKMDDKQANKAAKEIEELGK